MLHHRLALLGLAVLTAGPAGAQTPAAPAAAATAAAQQPQQAPPAAGLITERNISAALAAEAAAAAVEACAGRGWRVTAAVMDRSGVLKALLRGDGAGPHTVGSASGKAFTAASLRNPTTALQEAVRTNPGASQLPAMPGVLLLGGGLPIRAGDEVVGAIGVGGAPAGNLDEQCAEAGVARIRDRLQ